MLVTVRLPALATHRSVPALLDCCDMLRRAPSTILDMSLCEGMDPLAIGLLGANLAAREMAGYPAPEMVWPAAPKVRALLNDVEFDTILRSGRLAPPGTLEVRRLLAHDPNYIDNLTGMLTETAPALAHSVQLCLIELTGNAFEHAGSKIGCVVHSRWCEDDRRLRIAVVDCGRGIPAALRDPSQSDDDIVVRAVTKFGVTSRLQRHGGLGLKTVHQLVTQGGGRLTVVSARAKVTFIGRRVVRSTHGVAYPGTAIELDFPPKAAPVPGPSEPVL